MNKILFLSSHIFILVILFSCSTMNKKTQEVQQQKAVIPVDFKEVKVVDMSALDGCKFLLKAADDQFYLPFDGMPQDWEDTSKVFAIKYESMPDIASVCMKGAIISVIEVIEIK